MPNQGLAITSPSVRPVCSTWSCCYWVLVSLPWINHIIIVILYRYCRGPCSCCPVVLVDVVVAAISYQSYNPWWGWVQSEMFFIPKFYAPWNCKPAFKVFPWKGCKSFLGMGFMLFSGVVWFSVGHVFLAICCIFGVKKSLICTLFAALKSIMCTTL